MMIHHTTLLLSALFAVISLAACGDDGEGSDTGPAADTGTPSDSAPPSDSGMNDDTGTPSDSSTGSDGGSDSGSDSGATDSSVGDGGGATCPDLMPTQGADNVIISQIDLANDTIEFFNPSDTAVPLDGLVLCQRPQYTTISGTGITIDPGGYATLDALGGVNFETTGAGELGLYNSASYASRTAMVDFVCWDGDRTQTRKSVAEMANGGGEVLWAGACAGATSMGVVRRTTTNAGTGAADYDVSGALEAHACP